MVNIHDFKRQQRTLYNKIRFVYSPALKDKVYFTSEGFNHLIYKHSRYPRNVKEQVLKLRCLLYVPEVIKKCKLVTKTRRKSKDRVFYELPHKVHGGRTIRVVILKTGNGKYKFLSVMPHNRNRI